MVCPAQRDREFVADLLSQAARLRKTQVVRVTGLAAADEAGLFRNEPQMLLVPQPFISGRVSMLLSMRERISSFAADGSNSAGWPSSGVDWIWVSWPETPV